MKKIRIAGLCLFLACLIGGVGYKFLPLSIRQGDLDWWGDERAWNREEWLNKARTDDPNLCLHPGNHYLRGLMVGNMPDVYPRKQSEIKALLGPPDGHRQLKDGLALWQYELGQWDDSRGNYLTIIFNGDRVQATNYGGPFEEME